MKCIKVLFVFMAVSLAAVQAFGQVPTLECLVNPAPVLWGDSFKISGDLTGVAPGPKSRATFEFSLGCPNQNPAAPFFPADHVGPNGIATKNEVATNTGSFRAICRATDRGIKLAADDNFDFDVLEPNEIVVDPASPKTQAVTIGATSVTCFINVKFTVRRDGTNVGGGAVAVVQELTGDTDPTNNFAFLGWDPDWIPAQPDPTGAFVWNAPHITDVKGFAVAVGAWNAAVNGQTLGVFHQKVRVIYLDCEDNAHELVSPEFKVSFKKKDANTLEIVHEIQP